MLNNIVGVLGVGGEVATNFDSIATSTPSGVTSVTFSSIPSTYKHLQLRIYGRTSSALVAALGWLRFNGSSTAADYYDRHMVYGDGASVAATAFSGYGLVFLERVAGSSAGTNTFGTIIVDILDYANTNKYKTVRQIGGVDNNGSGQIWYGSGLFMKTNAISSIEVSSHDGSGAAGGNWQTGTHIALYGIKA